MTRLERIEARVVRAVAGGWASDVAHLRREVLALHGRGEAERGRIAALLGLLAYAPGHNAAALLAPAVEHGNAAVKGATEATLTGASVKAIRDAEAKPGAAVAEVRRRLRVIDPESFAQLVAALHPLDTSVSEMESALSWSVHSARNSAVVQAAAQTGSSLVFQAERDACVRCIAYAGDTDEESPGFGGGPSFLGGLTPAIPYPPVHPRCRCELVEFSDPAVPLAMKREAVRSVLRGFSLPSESDAQRRRAARNALDRGLDAPESVKEFARQNLRKGKVARRVP